MAKGGLAPEDVAQGGKLAWSDLATVQLRKGNF